MTRRSAFVLLAVLAAAGLYCATGISANRPEANSLSDIELFRRVAERVQAGEGYYPALESEARARGYPFIGSVFNWRLPTLTWFQAALPSPALNPALLTAVALTSMGLWFTFFLRQGMVASLGVAVLLLPMLPLAMHDGWSRLHDVWAGQLIGASLASRALGFRRGSVVLAALALSIRELALGYVLLMAAFAFYERRRREAIAWVIVIAAFMAGLVAHAAAASRVITDEAIAPNWVALGGWCFVLRASRAYFALFFTPTWINAMAVAAALVGFTQWAGATGRRAGLTVAGYLAGFMILGLPVNWYWGLLIAPILPLGLMGWLMTELGPEE